MFEAHVLNLLRKYLGEYVRNIPEEALKISVWQGDVVLKDLELKAEALNALKLPITVKAGFLGSVRLKVPWSRLGKDPVIVLLDRIFVLAEPARHDVLYGSEDDEATRQAAKRRKVEEAELLMLEAKDKKDASSETSANSSWIGSLISTVVGNLKIQVTNVHIRYEDTWSHPGHPFCTGLSLASAAVVTIDENGNETFVTSGALDRLRKAFDLDRLAVYHDSDSQPWEIGKSWDDLTAAEWSEIFEPGITAGKAGEAGEGTGGAGGEGRGAGRQYLLHPVGARARYLRQGKKDQRAPDVPYQTAALVLNEVALTLTQAQYGDSMKLLEAVSWYRKKAELAPMHPRVPVVGNAAKWWVFAKEASLKLRQGSGRRMSWKELARLGERRRKYVAAYTALLTPGNPHADSEEIQEIEKEISADVIILWRMLSHNAYERVRPKDAAVERTKPASVGWIGWMRGTRAAKAGSEGEEGEGRPAGLSQEEWAKIDELVQYEPAEAVGQKQEAPCMLQVQVEVSMEKNRARVVDYGGREVLSGAFDGLKVGLDMYPKQMKVSVELAYYGLTAPEGELIESVSRRGREGALSASYVLDPLEHDKLDWMLQATMSPCHVTVWRASVDRFLNFLKSGQAASPGVAAETAALVQNKLADVRRQAQEQLQQALQQRKRFSIDLDLDAPKVAIPTGVNADGGRETQLLLDLGHFTLKTDQDESEEGMEGALYTRFKVAGTDISAFLVDGSYDWNHPRPPRGRHSSEAEGGSKGLFMLPVLDRCGMSAVLQQMMIQHPKYPTTRVAVWLPRLGFHFSPARFGRLMRVLSAVMPAPAGKEEGVEEQEEAGKGAKAKALAWQPADHSGPMWNLNWTGIGSTTATWEPHWGALSGAFFYLLDDESATSYRFCHSLIRKAIAEIPPDLIGGTENVIAICNRGYDINKVVRSGQAVIIRCRSREDKAGWMDRLTSAVYQSSAPAAMSMLDSVVEEEERRLPRGSSSEAMQPQLYILGALDQLQLYVGGTASRGGKEGMGEGEDEEEEVDILELRASGGKVEFLQRQCDLAIGVGVHELELEDLFQGSKNPAARYMAHSLLSQNPNHDHHPTEELSEAAEAVQSKANASKAASKELGRRVSEGGAEEEEEFADAEEELGSPESTPSTPRGGGGGMYQAKLDIFFDAQDLALEGAEKGPSMDSNTPSFGRVGYLLPGHPSGEAEKEEQATDFVKFQLLMRQAKSPEYDGTDMKIILTMTTLEFYCNRPTVSALMDLGGQLARASAGPTPQTPSPGAAVPKAARKGPEGLEPSVVTGLLGRGKARVVFQLNLDMERGRIFLNLEDGTQLAMLEQEKIAVEIKMYPGSMKVGAQLGNLRFCNMRLGPHHQWGWFCDLRDPGSASLVKLEFCSYNPEDDDYEGYEYSLTGQLSAVRIVFLYRFISELTAYFMGLVASGSQQAVVSVVDAAAGGIERLIQQSELNGSPGVKLDVSMDAPVLIMPRNSTSSDFMQIGLGHLQVSSSVEWRGGDRDVPSAVRVDVMTVESRNINLAVGMGTKPLSDMVQELAGLSVMVQRPLRDLFKRLPSMEIHVKMQKLRAVMSDKEYALISECALANMAEPPQLPPSFRKLPDAAATEPSKQQKEVDLGVGVVAGAGAGVERPPSAGGRQQAYTTMRVSVELEHAELELFTGSQRDASLALLEIRGVWVLYRTGSKKDTELLLTLPKLSILDRRPSTRPEMRLALGSVVDVDGAEVGGGGGGGGKAGTTHLTMLVMNRTTTPGYQSIVVRLQRPRMLVAMDFLLAIGEFFVPSLGSMAGKESERDVREDPIKTQHNLLLSQQKTKQMEGMVWICPEKQLVADDPDVDEYEYDGGGNTLVLLEDESGVGVSSQPPSRPLIVIGDGKRLRFMNITIQNGEHLDACVQLGSSSSYTASTDDRVLLQGSGVDAFEVKTDKGGAGEWGGGGVGGGGPAEASPASDFALDVQAIAPELTFYDSTKWPSGTLLRPEKLLRLKLDVNLLFALKGKDRWVKGAVKGMMVENAAGLAVLEPLDAVLDYAGVGGKTTLAVETTDVSFKLPLNVVRLVTRLGIGLSTAMKLGGGAVTARCTQFDRVWQTPPGVKASHQLTFWRPRAPPGYVIVGDCATGGSSPPSQAVLAINTGFRRVRRPIGFELLWSSASITGWSGGEGEGCYIWRPEASEGYAALGCVVTKTEQPPATGMAHCVRKDLLASASVNDCIYFDEKPEGSASMWRLDNSVGTFFVCSNTAPPPRRYVRDLRPELRYAASTGEGSPEASDGRGNTQDSRSASKQPLNTYPSKDSSRGGALVRQYAATTSFERVWWDKGGDTKKHATIWRPQPPAGYCILGDTACEGFDPPDEALAVYDDQESGRLAMPVEFTEKAVLTGKGWEEATIWFPVAPPGYVALGCVAARGRDPPAIDIVRCVRMDLVNQKSFGGRPVWTFTPGGKKLLGGLGGGGGGGGGGGFSLWAVENKVGSFIVHADQKKPPWRMAYSLAELEKARKADNVEAQIKATRISATICDDLSGVTTPLVDASVGGIDLTVHGRSEALDAVVFTKLAASTYNTQLGVWEPLLEPFEGIFKYESREEGLEGGGSNVRITATSVVNVNLTAAGLDAMAGAVLFWNKTVELEEATKQLIMPGGGEEEQGSALQREEGLRLVVENQLGAPLYARTALDGFVDIQTLETGSSAALSLPPLRFPELMHASMGESSARQVRHFVALRIAGAEDLAVLNDISGQEYVVQLMLLPTQQTKQLPQSARTRAVRAQARATEKKGGGRVASARWDEVFVFELPQQGGARLELRVTNQAANAGKGEAVGVVSIALDSKGRKPSESHWEAVKAALSIGSSSNVKETTVPLHAPRKQMTEVEDYGSLSFADYAFTVGPSGHMQTPARTARETADLTALDAVLELAASPEGPWTGLRSMTAMMTVPLAIQEQALAVEMGMRQSLKCVTLRSLAVVWNSTDVALDLCVCPKRMLFSQDATERVEEEVYENQRYSPIIMGWGSTWPGHLLPTDPAKFSHKDLSNSSQEISKPLPRGWEWTDSWHTDRSVGDEEGWFYGPDFGRLKASPPTGSSSMGPFDFVRRRRLVRSREKGSGGIESHGEGSKGEERVVVGVLQAGESKPLPWGSLLAGTDWCLQLRPHGAEGFGWSKVVVPAAELASKQKHEKVEVLSRGGSTGAFMLSDLAVMREVVKQEELLECSSGGESFWLCIEADPTQLQSSEVSVPVIDWRFTVRAPLKLENRLPCVAECLVYEKPQRGGAQAGRAVKRHHGLVQSGEGVHVYSVDIRCQVLFTWLPQGGWKHEKDFVVISDPWARALPGNFWMVHSHSHRRLRVSVENDMGGSDISAKIVRLFVPYWLRNDATVPLSCRLVEIEPPAKQQADSNWLHLASKAAKNSTQMPEHSGASRVSAGVAGKVLRSLEVIEDAPDAQPIMLSLPSTDNVGLAVALNSSGVFSTAIALKAFEDKMERVDLKAVGDNASYIKLSVSLDLSSLGYERTKVVRLQPHTLFSNRLGQQVVARQYKGSKEEHLSPSDPDRPLLWESIWQPELLQIRLEGYQWSRPFSVNSEGCLHVVLTKTGSMGRITVRAEVLNGVDRSRFLVVFQPASSHSPYKVENRSRVLPMRFRQVGTDDESWSFLLPGSSLPFTWEDLSGARRLEVMVDGAEYATARTFPIDQEAELEPNFDRGSPVAAIRIVTKREVLGVMCVQLSDWLPHNVSPSSSALVSSSGGGGASPLPEEGLQEGEGGAGSRKFTVLLQLDDFGVSITDHTPEELLYVSMQQAFFSYDSNASGSTRMKMRVGHLQIDNQLPMTAMPVLLAPSEVPGVRQDYVLKLTIASQKGNDVEIYPYIGMQLPSDAWLVNIHEPIIWRLHNMVTKLNFQSMSAAPATAAVAVDPLVHIGLLNISEGRLKLTLAMAPSQRPRGILGMWSTLIASLGNTDEMPICVSQKVREKVHMRKSQMVSASISAISNDLLSQPFQLLSGLDVLGNASSALGNLSKGVAALSMDSKFIRSRQTQESKASVENLGDGLREGGEALAKGLFRGVTGILTKPLEGAREYGMEGFVSGVGKGLIGVAAQPMSGVLDLVSKATDGVNAERLRLSAAMSAKTALKRHRLPRAIKGDKVVRPYDDYGARGQMILQLAERGALFGSIAFDVKERAKYAMSDAYEEHFNLPGKRTLVITNLRVMLLQHPAGGIGSKRADLLKDPCSILWDISWEQLMTLELKSSREDPPHSPPSRLVLHLRDWSGDSRLFDTKEIARVVVCHPASTQAMELRDGIQRAMEKYGPDRAAVAALVQQPEGGGLRIGMAAYSDALCSPSAVQTKKRRAESRPYTGAGAGAASGAALGLLTFAAAPVAVPVFATFGALLGSAGQVMLEADSREERGEQVFHTPKETEGRPQGSVRSLVEEELSAWTGQVVRSFKLVWLDKGALWSEKYPVSIWRAVPPPGFVSVGDLAVAGHEQPERSMVYRDDGDGKFADPDGFDLVWRDTDSHAKTPVTIWMPRAPSGYVSLGAVAVADYYEPNKKTIVKCVRRDCVSLAELGRCIWRDRKGAALWKCGMWAVMNDAHTFLARRDHQQPTPLQAFIVSV